VRQSRKGVFGSLRARLLLSFLAFAVVPGAVLAWFAYGWVRAADLELELEHVATTARSCAAAIRASMELHRARAGFFAEHAGKEGTDEAFVQFNRYPSNEFLYARLAPDGTVEVPGVEERRVISAEALRELRRGAYVPEGAHLLVGVPLADGGAAAVAVPLSLIEAFVADSAGLGGSGRRFVVDASGRTVAGRGSGAAPARAGAYVNGAGQRVLGAAAEAGGLFVVAEVDEAEAAGPLNRVAGLLLRIGSGVLALVLCGILYAASRAQRFLASAVDALERASRGEFGAGLEAARSGAFGRLREAINRLHDRLQKREAEIAQQRQELFCQSCELARLNAEVVAADRLKSEFVANVSHEVRTPLHSILALSEVLLSQASGPLTEEQRRQVSIIQRGGESLLRMIGDILDLGKIEAGRMSVAPERVHPGAAVAAVRDAVGPLAEAKGLALLLEVESGLPEIVSDAEKLHRILLNLAHNAVKFTRKGSVTLAARAREGGEDPGTVEFVVKDTGCGIPPEELGRIFLPFRQVDGSLSRREGGTGLGLTIARSLAELLGARIAVESVPGAGSVFTLIHPPRCRSGPTGGPRPSLDRGDLLVVGANPAAGDALREELAANGLSAARAVCGRDVRRAVDAGGIGAILIDAAVLAGEGLEVFASVGARIADRGVPLLGYWLDPEGRRGRFLGTFAVERTEEGTRIACAGCEPLRLPERISAADRAAAELWAAAVRAGPAAPLHEVVRALVKSLDAQAPRRAAARAGGRRVLVLDPDPDGRYSLVRQLERLGFDAVAAAAIGEWPESFHADVVVTESRLPDVADPIAAVRARCGAPVVVLTSDARADTRDAALRAGVAAFLAKPVSTAQLAAALAPDAEEARA
jgi:signal transduction histidine kinase/DNA-binding response OmpR family regulator